nr:ECF transporter S component [uncultured Treponema sp.]
MSKSVSLNKPKLSVGVQVLATLIAIAAAFVLPQLFHYIGRVSGVGKSLGVMFCPMHFPVILVGILAGPFAGAATGLLSPLVNSLITGMPAGLSLPLMMVELFGYGLAAGLLRNVRMDCVFKVFIAQIAGRVLRNIAVIIAIYAFGQKTPMFKIWRDVPGAGIGLAMQLVMIPLIVMLVDRHSEKK